MRIKPGVRLRGIRTELLTGLLVCQETFREHGVRMTLTSINDSKHSRGSLHFQGAAGDASTKDTYIGDGGRTDTSLRESTRLGGKLAAELAVDLGKSLATDGQQGEFDVVYHPPRPDDDYPGGMHIEYQPKS